MSQCFAPGGKCPEPDVCDSTANCHWGIVQPRKTDEILQGASKKELQAALRAILAPVPDGPAKKVGEAMAQAFYDDFKRHQKRGFTFLGCHEHGEYTCAECCWPPAPTQRENT